MKIATHRSSLFQLKLVLIALFSIGILSAKAQSNCDFIEKVQAYQRAVKLKQPHQKFDVIDTTTFNTDTYKNLFTKLHLRAGMELRCVFSDEGTGGVPLLYAVPDTFNVENYIEQKLHKINLPNSEFEKFKRMNFECELAYEPQRKASYNMIPEDNEEGYLQFLYFSQMGEQFALKWHANYGLNSVICSKEEMKRVFKILSNVEMYTIDTKKFNALMETNLEPIVRMDKDQCFVTWYEILIHNGIYFRTYAINRSFPHSIEKTIDGKILGIQANFVY